MNFQNNITLPETYLLLQDKSKSLGFEMNSDLDTCALIRLLVATKPNGRFLELGTGVGLALSWMVDGMDINATITSVDNNQELIDTVTTYFENDSRVSLVCQDGTEWIQNSSDERFDLIFADAWPGKFSEVDETLDMLGEGGIYFIDDLLPADNWPEGHAEKVDSLIKYLDNRSDLSIVKLDYSTGLLIATKRKK